MNRLQPELIAVMKNALAQAAKEDSCATKFTGNPL